MQSWEEKVMERERGREEGREEGRNEVNNLYGRLMEAGRIDDLKRATEDEAYLEQLLEEFRS